MVRSHHLWFWLLLLLRDATGRGVVVGITKTTGDEISPSLHNHINLINTNTLSDENLMMAGIGRNM